MNLLALNTNYSRLENYHKYKSVDEGKVCCKKCDAMCKDNFPLHWLGPVIVYSTSIKFYLALKDALSFMH